MEDHVKEKVEMKWMLRLHRGLQGKLPTLEFQIVCTL